LLVGRLRDEAGEPMVPVSTHKANGQRYRYYVSKPLTQGGAPSGLQRVSASAIEELVEEAVMQRRSERERRAWAGLAPTERRQKLRDCVASVSLRTGAVDIRLAPDDANPETTVTIAGRMRRSARGTFILPDDPLVAPAGKPDRALIQAVARAHHWRELLESGHARTPYDIARYENCRVSYVQRHLPLGFLSPALAKAILDGHQPAGCTLKDLVDHVALSWRLQATAVA
jgi:hypothetical protein